MQMVVQKKNSRDASRCLTRLAPTRFGGEAEREQGESEVVVSAAYAVTGRGWRQFFGNAPDLHTPLCGFEGGAKGDRQPSLYTTADLWVSSLARRRVSSAQGNDEGGRADGSKRLQPGGGKKLPSSCCVLPYCRHLL